MQKVSMILEVANVHGGEEKALFELMDACAFKTSYPLGIKFQPFQANTISEPDYEWYPVYEKLNFSRQVWKNIISRAYTLYDEVWLDLFDSFGILILKENIFNVHGVKLQASVLENKEILSGLYELDVSDKKCLINISGFEIGQIESILDEYGKIGFFKIILQVGFQGYPTKVEETSLNKVRILKSAFSDTQVCFADHIDAEDEFSKRVPLLAAAIGCEYIEKHVCLSRNNTTYDYYSALEPDEMFNLLREIEGVQKLFGSVFINDGEREYLRSTIQKPLAVAGMKSGDLVSADDVLFRRTSQDGITLENIKSLQQSRYLLRKDKKSGEAFTRDDFKPAKIAVIVAGRMKSSRLKKKAVLPICGIPSVEHCLARCLEFPADMVVLATSTMEEDAVLQDYTLGGKVNFWRGDPDDVISRYLEACEAYGIDIVIRVTADCPVVSSEIASFLLDAHLKAGADYTAAVDVAPGTGSEIYNVRALKKVIEYMGAAKYSEYMTWYMQNNKDIFKVNNVNLPRHMIRDYRLTLDYREDLLMFEKLFERLAEESKEINLENIFQVLDNDKSIVELNSSLTLVYKTDQVLINKLNEVTKIRT